MIPNDKNSDGVHHFCLYVPRLFSYVATSPSTVSFKDEALWHRIVNVLRLTSGQRLTLFDEQYNVSVEIKPEMLAHKKQLHFVVMHIQEHKALAPKITLGIGLTKKAALEDIAYHAGQLGITNLVPLLTEKVQRKWGGEKESDRLFKSAIAGCEQSKNFVPPRLMPPAPLDEFCEKHCDVRAQKIFFESGGMPFLELLNDMHEKKPPTIVCIIGPEGGSTTTEQNHLVASGFEKIALTPTVLRSVEAVAVGVGGIRSIFSAQQTSVL